MVHFCHFNFFTKIENNYRKGILIFNLIIANEHTLNDLKNNPYSIKDFIGQVEAEIEHLKGKRDDEGAIIFVDDKIRRSHPLRRIAIEKYSVIC